MKKFLSVLFFIFSLSILYAQNGENQSTLNNAKVIEMKKAKLSKVLILKSIEESEDFNYDTSTNGLKELSENQLADDIIILMMKKQKEKNASIKIVDGINFEKNEFGLFINANNQKVKIISHLTQINFKKNVFGANLKATLPKANSEIVVESSIKTFYFNMNVDENASTNTTYNITNSISDPNEGQLVKLSKNGKYREIQLGKFGMGGLKTKIPEKYRVEYKVEKVKYNLYKITVDKMEPGEYGFIFGAINPGAAMKIYDFTVK